VPDNGFMGKSKLVVRFSHKISYCPKAGAIDGL